MLALNPDLAKILNLQTQQNQGPQTRPLAAPRRVFPAIPSNNGSVAGGGALLLKTHFRLLSRVLPAHFGTPWKINMEPENIWKWPNWKGKSSSKPPCLGSMLIFKGVANFSLCILRLQTTNPTNWMIRFSMKHQGITLKVIGKHLASILVFFLSFVLTYSYFGMGTAMYCDESTCFLTTYFSWA